jgi:hypothetical protein
MKMRREPGWKVCCQAIAAVVFFTAFLVIIGSFAFVASMCLRHVALQGWKEAAFAVAFFGASLLFCIGMTGSVASGVVDRLRPENSHSSNTSARGCMLWGCVLMAPFALLGAIVPPTQEVFLFGTVLVGICFLSVMVSGWTYGILGNL